MTAEVMRLAIREMPPESIRTLIRATVSAIEASFNTIDRLQSRTRLSLALSLLETGAVKTGRFERPTAALAAGLAQLGVDDRHYWISTFFTLLMSVSLRREKATYFTPPPVVRHLIDQAEKAGLDLKTARVIDPAAGGAAFVSSLAGRMTELGCSVEDIRCRISGIEIDRHLALLGEALLCDRLGETYGDGGAGKLIRIGDSLTVEEAASYDAVFVNPPYGRIMGLPGAIPPEWLTFSAPGHINRYALFMDLAFRMAKPGGLVATVSPSSFISGPLFGRLREYIRARAEVVRIDVLERKDVFHDVQQDACVAIFQMRSGGMQNVSGFSPKFGRLDRNWSHMEAGAVAAANGELSSPWVLPSQDGHDGGALERCTARLSDYGVSPKAGYFVWNREQDRLQCGRKFGTAYPLFWAQNVKPGRPCMPSSKKGAGIDFVKFDAVHAGIIRRPSIILQRTTNSKQPRRLIAATIPRKVLKKHKGFVSENHTILLVPEGRANLSLLCKLLNTNAVDRRFRRIGGTQNVSIESLRNLPLPAQQHLRKAMMTTDDFEAAVESAYGMSAAAAESKAA
ncbi:Eco57I restriction-modification methylase domain-containing protein [Bradyrhizobium genosp. P]|uniref:Eco57I restriction-modification methylase domain-containing protein n=1 Tax=Bradyrhizobium genosp. P TaxID=83641 RepID=UPI003CF7B82F